MRDIRSQHFYLLTRWIRTEHKRSIIERITGTFSGGCIDFGEKGSDEFYEMIAMEDEALLDHYLESGEITESKIREMIAERKIFPCFLDQR